MPITRKMFEALQPGVNQLIKGDQESAQQDREIAARKALQEYLHGTTQTVRSQVPDAAFNSLPEGQAGPVAPESARFDQVFKPGALGQQKLLENEQAHNLTEQGALNRFAALQNYFNGHPGVAVSLTKEGASISPKDPGQALPLLTPAQEAAEKAAGKSYEEYEAAGGRANLEKNISQLQEVQSELGAEKDPRSWLDKAAGGLPRGLRALLTPGEVAREDRVRNAVQATLKQTLGGQFTEREAEAIMNRAYDPRLSTQENLARVQRTANELTQKKAQMDRSGEALRRTGYATIGVKPEPSKFGGSSSNRTPVKVERNKKTGQVRTTYSDGTVEVK